MNHETDEALLESGSKAIHARPVAWLLCAAALIVTHTILVDHFVPFRTALSNKPLQGVDYDLHIGQVFRVVEALQRWGRTWLYDVQLLAGQPEGTITDSGSKGWELWTFALCWLGVPRAIAFNSFVSVIMLTAPLWLWLAARTFRLGRWASLSVAAMSSSLWFFDSHLHWVWFVGMVSWCGASCLAMLTLALFYRAMERSSSLWTVGCGASLGIGLLIHPYTFFVLAPPMFAMYARAFRKLSLREHAWVAVAAVFSIAINAFWLHNAVKHWHYILNSAFYAQARAQYMLCDFFDVLCNGADSGVIGTRTGFRFLYLGLAIAGLAVMRSRRDDRFLPIACCLAALYIVAYLGGFIPGMQQTQPYRQVTPAMLLTTLPATLFLSDVLAPQSWAAMSRITRWLIGSLCFALVQQLLATQVLYYLPELVPVPALHPDGARSPLSGYGHVSYPGLPVHVRYSVPHDATVLEYGMESLISYIEHNCQRGDRMLVETSVIGERIAWRTGLEVLGGFFERNIQHVDANYFREHRTYRASHEQLAHYLQTFAVQWVVSSRSEFRDETQLLRSVASQGEVHVYRVLVPVNRMLRGGGQVSASENLLQVRNSDPKQTLVLSYHWHEALRCKPDCRVERESVDIDRVGFVRIPAPHAPDLTVWNSYESW